MNKKVIRNILLLLLIPIIITIIVSVYNKNRERDFSTSVTYSNSSYVENHENIYNNSSNTEDENLSFITKTSYPTVIISSFTLIVIFTIFYMVLTKKKGW